MSKTPERIPLPWSRSCFICGESNPRGLRARSFRVGDRVELPFVAPIDYAGWNEVMHGGFIATVLDEVMTWAAILGRERPCFAAEFSVRLQRPLVPDTACMATAWVRENRRRLLDTEAELRDGAGTRYAVASGRYVPIRGDQTGRLRHDFVQGPGCLPVGHFFA